MESLFRLPTLDLDDRRVIDEVHDMREQLRHTLHSPRRWPGLLRRTLLARAIRGSNSIEGYQVTVDDAVAAVDDEEPLEADARSWVEVVGYRSAMSYVLQLGKDPNFRYDPAIFRSLHYMMLSHDLTKSPGHYRAGTVYVRDDATGEIVYEGPDASRVAVLMEAFTTNLNDEADVDPLVKGAMAHLNLVMIHPFRDGNGRMARAAQTLVLARDEIVAPEFASIEEWLGRHTPTYYRVLAVTGAGAWSPGRDAHLWVKFNLRAHHMQAQLVQRRADMAGRMWMFLEELCAAHGFPERSAHALFDAASGFRVRRPTYVKLADIEGRTASRDLAELVGAGWLFARGATRGRYYVAGEKLAAAVKEVAADGPRLIDPFPTLPAEIEQAANTGTNLH